MGSAGFLPARSAASAHRLWLVCGGVYYATTSIAALVALTATSTVALVTLTVHSANGLRSAAVALKKPGDRAYRGAPEASALTAWAAALRLAAAYAQRVSRERAQITHGRQPRHPGGQCDAHPTGSQCATRSYGLG